MEHLKSYWQYYVAAIVLITLAIVYQIIRYKLNHRQDIIYCPDTKERFNMKKQPYQDYLNSKHFQALRRREYLKEKGICHECRQPVNPNTFVLHHWTYDRIGRETSRDVSIVCNNSKCHGLKQHQKVKTVWYAKRNGGKK